MALEFAPEEGRGLAAAGVARLLGAEEDYGEVGTGAAGELVGDGRWDLGGRGFRGWR